jgi:hypothetical protein
MIRKDRKEPYWNITSFYGAEFNFRFLNTTPPNKILMILHEIVVTVRQQTLYC